MSDKEINQIMRALGRIEGILERISPLVDGHEKAIGELQLGESYRKGQSAIISLLVSTAISVGSIFYRK